jgi:hypothetical protein
MQHFVQKSMQAQYVGVPIVPLMVLSFAYFSPYFKGSTPAIIFGTMTKDQADSIVDVFYGLLQNSEQYWLKIEAAEWVIKTHSPELWEQYRDALARRENDAKVWHDHEESVRILEVLRRKLSTDPPCGGSRSYCRFLAEGVNLRRMNS